MFITPVIGKESYFVDGRFFLRYKQILLLAIGLASFAFSASASDFALKTPTATLASVAADAATTYTLKASTPNTNGADIPLNNSITYSFPLGTLVTGTDPNNGNATVTVTGTFKNQNGGSTVSIPVLTFGIDGVTGGPTITFPAPAAVGKKKPFTTTFTGIVNPTTGGSKTATVSATNSSGGQDRATFKYSITAAGANKLAFVNNPTAPVYAGRVMSPPVTVVIQDRFGNTVTTATNTISLAIGTNPSSGTLTGGTPAVAPVSGIATFNNLSINNTGVGYTLTATATPVLTTGTSAAFNVVTAPANFLQFSTQPVSTTAGTSFTVAVTIKDGVTGNPVTGSSFTIHLSTFPSTVSIFPAATTTVLAATNPATGIATYSNISLQTAGTYNLVATEAAASGASSNQFTISAATASTLVFFAQPADSVAGDATNTSNIYSADPTVPVEVAVVDAFGNIVTGATTPITIAINTGAGGTLSADSGQFLFSNAGSAGQNGTAAVPGVAIFDNLNINLVGSYTLKGNGGTLTQALSTSFNITPDSAATLTVSNIANPSTVQTATDVKVTAKDLFGNVATGYTGIIGFTSVPAGATLPANYTFVSGDAGVHTFTGGVTFHSTSGSTSVTATDTVTATITGSQTAIVVNKSTPVFSNLSAPTITFGSTPTVLGGTLALGSQFPSGNVTITVNGVAQSTAISAVDGSFSSSFATGALSVNTYVITYAYAGDANFSSVSNTTKNLIVTKVTPAFSNLNAPTITFGTTPTALAGTIKLGTLFPSGNVAITVNGVTQNATINPANGTFTFNFATGSLVTSTYTITYAYAGDANFNAVTDNSKILTVNKATPVFSSLSAPTITYGTTPTSLGGTIALGAQFPSGNVTITVNGVPQTAPISAVNGSFSFSFATGGLTVGTYPITYAYAGDSNFIAVSNTANNLVVTKATPVFSNLSAPTITFGTTPTTLSGTIKLGTLFPTGNVAITVNGVAQNAAIDAATGNFTFNFTTGSLTVGTYTITYAYAGDSNFIAVSNAANNLIVSKATPVFSNLSAPTITFGTTPTVLGGTLALGTHFPSGNVTITLNGVAQSAAISAVDGSFSSSFVTGSLNVNTYVITYAYAGDSNFIAVSNTANSLTVSKATPVFSGLSAPTIIFGDSPTALAGTIKLGSLVPTGTVAITVNGVTQNPTITLGTGAFTFNFSTGSFTAGTYQITYAYAGDSNFVAVTNTLNNLVVSKATPVFSGLSAPTITYGDSPTGLSGTIKVGALIPTGTVAITVNGVTQNPTIAPATGAFTFSFATGSFNAGTYAITYAYTGDANFIAISSNSNNLVVNKATPAFSNLSAPTIVINASPTALGGTIKLGALVPTGSVAITLNSVVQNATINPADGTFTFSFDTSALPAASYPITYNYAGDANFVAISNGTNNLIVSKGDPSTTIVQEFPNPSHTGDTVDFTVKVTPQNGPGITPTGTVTFMDGASIIGTPALVSGTATLSVAITGTGSHPITATYSGDANYNVNSDSRNQNVVLGTAATSIVSDGSPTTYGNAVTFTASIVPTPSATLVGTVSFKDGSTVIGTVTLNGSTPNTAVFATSLMSAGAHSITAVYNGDVGTGYPQSGSSILPHSVNKRALTITATSSGKIYDGNANAAATIIFSDDRVATDALTLNEIIGLATFPDKNIGIGKTVTITGITLSGTAAGNYTFNNSTSTTGDITVRAITVTASADTKTFNGTTVSAGVPTVTTGSIASGDTGTFTQTFDTSTASTGKTLTPTGSVTDGNSGNNYAITFVASTNGVINKASTTVVLGTSGTPVEFGTAVTITATVSSAAGTPAGTLTFTVDGTAQTGVTLTNGIATFSSSTLSAGDHSISASYGGATNFSSSVSSTLTQKITDTTPPVAAGSPTTDVSNGVVGQPVTFSWIVTDATAITFTWDFGDGTVITTTDTSVTQTYTVPGNYVVTVTATDAGGLTTSNSLNFAVTNSGVTTTTGDICDGLSPIAMHVQLVSAKLKFPSLPNSDTLTLKTIITLPSGFTSAGKIVQWQVGGFTGSATLTDKNVSTTTSPKVSLKFKKPKPGATFAGGPATLSVTMKGISLTSLMLTGITNLNATTTGTKGQAASTDFCVVLKDVQAYHADAVSGMYKAKKDKGGMFTAKFR